MADTNSDVITGARARLMINAIPVGYATDVDVTEEIRHEPIEVLGNIEVQEYVPVRYTVRLSMGFVRLLGKSLKALGWMPVGGKNAEERLKNLLTQGLLTAALEDTVTNKRIALLEQVKAESNSFRVGATGVTMVNAGFNAIRLRDEAEV